MSGAEPFESQPSPWHIAAAAEAFAAAQFARCGFDVSMQYGADQPEYDLIVSKGDNMLKVSVKGSQDGGWGVTQGYLRQATALSGKKPDYHGAIDLWLKRHGSRTVLCLGQFWDVPMDLVQVADWAMDQAAWSYGAKWARRHSAVHLKTCVAVAVSG